MASLSYIPLSAAATGSASGRLVYRPIWPQVVIPSADTGKTGTGGIDPGESGDGLRRRQPFKPTGFIGRPAKRSIADIRAEESAVIAAEVAAKLAREFTEDNALSRAALEAERAAAEILSLSRMQVDAEIAALQAKRRKSDTETLLLLMLIAATVA